MRTYVRCPLDVAAVVYCTSTVLHFCLHVLGVQHSVGVRQLHPGCFLVEELGLLPWSVCSGSAGSLGQHLVGSSVQSLCGLHIHMCESDHHTLGA